MPPGHAAVRRAAAFIDAKQLPDGTWYGRWGCNYIYGSFLALRGLLHAGEDMRQPRFQKTADWIRSHQNADGGWGELPHSYDDPTTKGIGPSTPSQTAWALVALFATGDGDSDSVRRGIDYLLAKQQYDGSWKDDHWTATGFPKVFYLRYHLYATVFPAPRPRALRARGGDGPDRPRHQQARGGRHRRAPHRSRSELMRFPVHMLTDNIQHQVKHAIKRQQALSLRADARAALHLQPRVHRLRDRAPHRQAQGPAAAREVPRGRRRRGAPVVSICGGEPTIYPELPELVSEIIERKRHIILCTNGLLLDENVFGKIAPHKRLTINVHLDGMRETHDYVCAREGVFDKAIEMIEEGVKLGHHMMANTTIFKETSMDEVEELCKLLTGIGVDGMLVSPGYHYESVDSDIFLSRSDMQKKFLKVLEISKKYQLTSTPMFLEFAAGLRDYKCSPWSTVTYTPERLEGALLPDRQDLVADVRRVLERDRLGVLGVAAGPPLPELRDALGLRGLRRPRAAEAPRRHGPDDRLEPRGDQPAGTSRAGIATPHSGSRLGSPMDLVTGGTGFVGSHVVRALLAQGRSVRCLVRPTSRRDNLEGLPVEIAVGDLTDPASLARALAGVHTLYHVAADYRLWAKDPQELYRANAGGTDSILAAAAAAGVAKVVYTSSVAALGLIDDGSPGDETTPVARERIIGHYKKSQVRRRARRRGVGRAGACPS